ncbi:hypothetical protein DFH05DRAFT_1456321 [Lentinula detonsa]|uniref:Uncharacterized protein n=1 Tax=Lentinula detonsa TaxID=2804962 RepID=A0A9W8PDD9_9AGAR|nr:hypothetical protein DFH05DRAFT_1456321 [Lentinula detonsa]
MKFQFVLLILVQAMTIMTVLYAAPLDHNVTNPRELADMSIHARAHFRRNVVKIQFLGTAEGRPFSKPKDSLQHHPAVQARLQNAFVGNYPYFDTSWKFSFRSGYNGTEANFIIRYKGIGNCVDTWCRMEVDQDGNGVVELGVGILFP